MVAKKEPKPETEKALLHDIEIDAYQRDCVKVFPETLQEEFVRVSADLAYWGERYSKALRTFLVAKLDGEATTAQLRIGHRERLLSENGKATESMVEAAVDSDDAMRESKMRVIEAEVEKVRLYGIIDAVRSKRDMLQSLGAQYRAELQHDPVTRDRAAAARGE